jgi:hypothetical protein
VGQSVEAAFDIDRPPVTDGFAADSKEIGHFGLREVQLTATRGTQAESLQDFIGQSAGIG